MPINRNVYKRRTLSRRDQPSRFRDSPREARFEPDSIRSCAPAKGLVESGIATFGIRDRANPRLQPVSFGGRASGRMRPYWWAVKTWHRAKVLDLPSLFDIGCTQARTWRLPGFPCPIPNSSDDVLLDEGKHQHNPTSRKLYHAMYLPQGDPAGETTWGGPSPISAAWILRTLREGAKAGDHRLDPGQTDNTRRPCIRPSMSPTRFRLASSARFDPLNGRYIDAYGFASARLPQILIDYADGSRETLVSDSSWFVPGPHPPNAFIRAKSTTRVSRSVLG